MFFKERAAASEKILKVMKRVRIDKLSKIYDVRKSYSSLTYILLSLENELRNIRLQQIRNSLLAWKTFLSACCCKNESEIGFLTVTSSWRYQHGFSAETSQFLSNTTHFYDYVANNLMNF